MPENPPPPSSAESQTITATATSAPATEYTLSLQPRPQVTWDTETVNNEGLGRKSSKRCCIFHKKRNYDSTSSESDYEGDENGGGDGAKPIARKKGVQKQKGREKVPDFQRFHA